MEALQTQSAQTAVAQLPPTFTAVPEPSPTNTLAPLDVTPTFITATPGGEALGLVPTLTLTPSEPEISDAVEVQPTLTPTLDFPTPLPTQSITTGFVTPIPPPVFSTRFDVDFVQSFTFTGVQSLRFNDRELQGGVSLFAPNPAFPESFARTLPSGLLVFTPPGGAEQPFTFSPFYQGYDAPDARSNKNYVSDIVWSPDGVKLAYLIAPPPDTDNIAAGVWFWQPEQSLSTDPSYALLHDCPAQGWLSCGLVSGRPANHWRSLKVAWSPDSNRLLVTLDLPEEGRGAIAVVDAVRDAQYANNAPPIARYDSGNWLRDGRLLVSGRRPSDGRVIIGTVNADFSDERVILDATASDLWVQDAVERSDGSIVAFGRPCCPGGALRLYRADGVPMGDFIGDNAPESIQWASNGDYAVVTVDGVQYVVNARTGGFTRAQASDVIEIQRADAPIVQQTAGGEYPTGIIEGSRYSPGQQVRYIGINPRNLRAEPSTTTAVIDSVLPSEFVAILAGPYENQGFVWWYVSNARDVRGWMADESTGASLLDP